MTEEYPTERLPPHLTNVSSFPVSNPASPSHPLTQTRQPIRARAVRTRANQSAGGWVSEGNLLRLLRLVNKNTHTHGGKPAGSDTTVAQTRRPKTTPRTRFQYGCRRAIKTLPLLHDTIMTGNTEFISRLKIQELMDDRWMSEEERQCISQLASYI